LLSIITPVLNGVNYIEKNILSILQLKIKYEHIIIDGGSIDGTIDIIKKYEHVKLFTQDKFSCRTYVDQCANKSQRASSKRC
jgi:glycosyltransferase involved in cell wall biosynthesis